MKISAICPIQLLERVSNLLRWQHVHKEFKLPWKQDVLPFLAEESPTYHVTSPPDPLTKEEEIDLTLAHERLSELCKACEQEGLPMLIDAEYSSVQPAIDYIIHAAAAEFNKGARPLIYGTIQAYLKDSFSRLNLAVKGSHSRGLSYGVKLVRGAYISRENEMASSLRVPSPIHANIEGTHRCYNSCAAFMLEQAANGDGAVVLATHNMDSGTSCALSLSIMSESSCYMSKEILILNFISCMFVFPRISYTFTKEIMRTIQAVFVVLSCSISYWFYSCNVKLADD